MKAMLCVFISLMIFSCGTSKRSTEVYRSLNENIQLSDSIMRKDSFITFEQILSNENLQAHIIITEWSIPDSLGKQFPQKTTEMDLNRQKDEQSVKSEVSGSNAIQVKKQETKIQEVEKVKDDVKKDTRVIPAFAWWFIIGGVIAALIAWIVRKKK